MTREEILCRYRHLREISTRHHSAALKYLVRPTIMDYARRLGLTNGKVLVARSEEELTLVFDLAIHTAREGRSRAIDRFAQAGRFIQGSDEALMLETMRHGRFSIWQVQERHETVGLVVTDMLRKVEAWLVDESLEATAPNGTAFAGRLCNPESFAMTSGVVVPLDGDLLDEVSADFVNLLASNHTQPTRLADDPRFATAIYRAAIEQGVMANVVFE